MRGSLLLILVGGGVAAATLTSTEARAACGPGDVQDRPDCACFVDTPSGSWNPAPSSPYPNTAVDLLDVAEQTASPSAGPTGVTESCLTSGGKAFWLMQTGVLAATSANTLSDDDPTYWTAVDRDPWCSETVALWHREAQVPYVEGYRNSWFLTWKIDGSRAIRNWYEAEGHPLRTTGRGFWLDDTELNLNGTFGEEIPCPGAYQRIVEFDSTLGTSGAFTSAHSHLVYSVRYITDASGTPIDLIIKTIDGNADTTNHETQVSAEEWRVSTDLRGNSRTPKHEERRIDGWGIDLVQSGGSYVSSCDLSHILYITKTAPYSPVYTPPPLPDTNNYDWYPFVSAVETSGLTRIVDGVSTTVDRVPQASVGEDWTVPAGDFADGTATVDIVWPAAMPFDVDGMILKVDRDDLTDIEVHAYDGSGSLLTSDSAMTDLSKDQIHVRFAAAVAPTKVRVVLDRPTGVTTDLVITDLQLSLSEEDDAATNP